MRWLVIVVAAAVVATEVAEAAEVVVVEVDSQAPMLHLWAEVAAGEISHAYGPRTSLSGTQTLSCDASD